MFRILLLLVALLALGSVVEARSGFHGKSALPHPEETADAAIKANWARIHRELAARNYTRPTRAQLNELGYSKGAPDSGVFGVDVSSWIGQSTWSCMKQKGYDFAIVREFQENCVVDPNGVHTVANAWAAGLAHVDVYLFPSYGCSVSAADQVNAVINSMGGIPFGTIWLDIEAGGQGSADNNHAWMMSALAEGAAKGRAMGIYSSQYEWGQVMGGLGGPTNYPVWYADYDGSPSFAGFRQFGGWTNPSMKQFAGDAGMCSADVDLNWYP